MPPPTTITSRRSGSSTSAAFFIVEEESRTERAGDVLQRRRSVAVTSVETPTERRRYNYCFGGGAGFLASAGFAPAGSPPGSSASSGTAFRSGSVNDSG